MDREHEFQEWLKQVLYEEAGVKGIDMKIRTYAEEGYGFTKGLVVYTEGHEYNITVGYKGRI